MTGLYIVIGIMFGGCIGWVLAYSHCKLGKGQIESELRQQISDKENQINAGRLREDALIAEKAAAVTASNMAGQQLIDSKHLAEEREEQLVVLRREALEQSKILATGQADLTATRNLLAEKQRLQIEYEGQLTTLRSEFLDQSKLLAKAQADLNAAKNLLSDQQLLHEKQMKDAKEAQDKAIIDLRDAFKVLSAEVLTQNAPEFLRLANESFLKFQETAKGDLSQRQESIVGLLKPLEEQLRTYQERLQQSETSQSTTIGEVKKQLETLTKQSESLAHETERFRMVLNSNQARGQWGEETLRRVVEASGMSAHCDFVEQTKGEDDKKPDMIVRLPGDRVIIVDAKVPDLDFLSALENADLDKRKQYLKAHADKLKDIIKSLADRAYPSKFSNSLDYVVLFLPAESLFSAALEGDRDLIIWAASKRIMLATPASLIALLRSVSISWQQFAQTENAQKIADAANELFGRVAKFTDYLGGIKTGLDKANEAFNKAVGSYERMVYPSGERLLKLGLNTDGKTLVDLRPSDGIILRLPSKSEVDGVGEIKDK